MADSLISFGLRTSLRTTRRVLRTTRELADLGLAALDLVGRALGEEPPPDPYSAPDAPGDVARDAGGPADLDLGGDVAVGAAAAAESSQSPDPIRPVEAAGSREPVEAIEAVEADHVDEEPERVDEVADPGAEDGAGASIHIDAPLAGYDALRAPDVIARLPGCDVATLGTIELYEDTHRRRRTVLDAVTRELRRRG